MESYSKRLQGTATPIAEIGERTMPTPSSTTTLEAQQQFLYTKLLKSCFVTLRASRQNRWTERMHDAWLERCGDNVFLTGDTIWRLLQ